MRGRLAWVRVMVVAAGLIATLMVTGLLSQAVVQERKVPVQPSELPAPIQRAIRDVFPKGEILAIEKEAEGENPGQYDVDIRSEGKVYEVEVSPEGKVIESKEKGAGDEASGSAGEQKKWTDSFHQEDCTFSSVGRNRFFILVPGHQLVLQGPHEKVTITVTQETKRVGDVETRIVEEREEEDGTLKEVSRNFFAICREHGDVFYFGEEVDEYKDGKLVGHSGAWRADEKDSKAGIMMPGTVLLGARHYQEIAPNAKDRAEIMADDVTMKTPAGTFKDCLRVEETSGIAPDEKGYKTYAPGVGLIQDEDLLLTGYHEGKTPRDQKAKRGGPRK